MNLRINKIKDIIKEKNCDSLIVIDNSDIRYLSGLVSSNIVLLITLDKSYVFSDGRYKFLIESQKLYEPVCINKPILECVKDKIIELKLSKTLIDPTHINHKLYAYLSNGINLKDTENITKPLRIIKDKKEINNIIKAQKIAEKAFKDTLTYIKEDMTTKEIASYLDYRMNMYGSEEVAFSSIVVNEKESANCHGVPGNKKIKKGDLLLFDFGATVNGYRSDMTRTIAIGEISEEKKKIYNVVYNAHKIAKDKLKPGVKCCDIDEAAREYIEKNGYGDLFLHSLGHGVGLDIHEYPTLTTKSDEVLKEGMIVTVEPGIYLKNKFGIRIEDTYIITENGSKSVANIKKNIIIV